MELIVHDIAKINIKDVKIMNYGNVIVSIVTLCIGLLLLFVVVNLAYYLYKKNKMLRDGDKK